MPRLKWLDVSGLRSFGIEQSLTFEEQVALLWGGNSQGKTSVAEAIEFLLSGAIVRPAMLGGAKNEYDRSLRNAYLPDGEEAVVRAGIEDQAGTEHQVERVLTADFGRGQDCASRLTVDGVEVTDLESIGIRLAEPPLRAPVLFQHSIRYALSASPGDRLSYFKALFEIGDLDELANSLKSVIDSLATPSISLETDIVACASDPTIGSLLGDPIGDLALTSSGWSERLRDACRTGITSLTGNPPDQSTSLEDLSPRLRAEIEQLHRGRFDLSAWLPGQMPTISNVSLDACRAYVRAVETVDRTVEHLRGLYAAVLKVPAHENLDHDIRCPVCDDGTLTLQRLEVLRQEVVAGGDLRSQQTAARAELLAVTNALRSLGDAGARLAPPAATLEDARFAAAESAASAILGEVVSLSAGRDTARELALTAARMAEALTVAQNSVTAANNQVDALGTIDVNALDDALASLRETCNACAAPRESFLREVSPTLQRVGQALSTQQGTTAWDALVRLAEAPDRTVVEIRRRSAVVRAKREFQAAHTAIEQAKLAVFREKFAGMSAEILEWWNRLRPDEPVVFERAEPRAGGRRYVDLKAKLSAGGIVEERDALGIFSDSQLNALGLAAFLARAVLQDTPFVVLDDPVQAGDDEHRDTFIDVALPALVSAGLQVIVTTHDSQLRTLLSNAHEVDGFTVTLEEPDKGTVVIKGTDTADALLHEAKGFIKETPSLRDTGAQKLRIAAERLAKEILVKKRLATGERASLSDYKKWSLDKLVPTLCEVLDDETEKGNWKNVSPRLSPGSHDDSPPAKNTLKTVRDQLIQSHQRHSKESTGHL